MPDPIASRPVVLDEDVGVTLHQATKLLERLQHAPTRIATLGAVAQNLLRSESVASSRIEGVLISHKRLARAAHQGPGKRRVDNRAAEVLGNVEAMKRAIELGAEARPITVPDLLEIHRRLLRFTEDRKIAGVVRTQQNWIGGSYYNPLSAAFVPPPQSTCRTFSRICAGLLSGTICRRLSKPRSPTRSSRPSIPLPMATVEPGAR